MIGALLLATLVAAPAQEIIEAGADAFRAARYDEALISFTKAYEALPDQPRLLWNVGRCLEELGRADEALDAFERYLERESGDSAGTREALTKVASLQAARRQRPATLRVETTPARARILVDGEPSGRAPVLLQVPEGAHTVAAELDGHLPAEARIAAQAGEALVVALALRPFPATAPAAQPEPPLPPGLLPRWAAPTVLAGAAAILAALAVNAFLDEGENADSAAIARSAGRSGDLDAGAAGALAADADDRAAAQALLGWTFTAAGAAAFGWASWSVLSAPAPAPVPRPGS